jgi:hypothetical protein
MEDCERLTHLVIPLDTIVLVRTTELKPTEAIEVRIGHSVGKESYLPRLV